MGFRKSGRARRAMLGLALAGGMMMAASPAFAQFGPAGPCTKESLKAATDSFFAALDAGDPAKLAFGGEWLSYNENMDVEGLNSGILSTPHKVDFSRTFYDLTSCTSYSEIISNDPKHPYVIGATVVGRNGKVGALDTLVTDQGDWLFDAQKTLDYSKAEKWDLIPEADRDNRETIIAAADAYLNSFSDKNVQVPWGSPCERLEGGMYTGKGKPGESLPADSCNVGVPSGIKMAERRYIVDPSYGVVSVWLRMGPNERPDVHTFRIEHGKIRYVHTMTVCDDTNMCGFKKPGEAAPGTPPASK